MLEWLRFTNTLKRILHGFSNYGVDAAEDFPVGVLPIEIIFPSVVRKNELHPINSFSVPSPLSSCEIDSISRLVFLGERKR